MKRLLVPVDGSEGSSHALRHAIERAREAGAEVHVLHVEPPMAYEELRVYVMREEIRQLRRKACERVLAAAATVLDEAKVSHVSHLLEGEVGQSIARFADAHHIDEVIMGTRGMGATGNLLLGSVATRVVHLAPVPVTLVK